MDERLMLSWYAGPEWTWDAKATALEAMADSVGDTGCPLYACPVIRDQYGAFSTRESSIGAVFGLPHFDGKCVEVVIKEDDRFSELVAEVRDAGLQLSVQAHGTAKLAQKPVTFNGEEVYPIESFDIRCWSLVIDGQDPQLVLADANAPGDPEED